MGALVTNPGAVVGMGKTASLTAVKTRAMQAGRLAPQMRAAAGARLVQCRPLREARRLAPVAAGEAQRLLALKATFVMTLRQTPQVWRRWDGHARTW